jgi:hypothetical protein
LILTEFRWKAATIHIGFEPGRRGIFVVGSHYQATVSEDIAG